MKRFAALLALCSALLAGCTASTGTASPPSTGGSAAGTTGRPTAVPHSSVQGIHIDAKHTPAPTPRPRHAHKTPPRPTATTRPSPPASHRGKGKRHKPKPAPTARPVVKPTSVPPKRRPIPPPKPVPAGPLSWLATDTMLTIYGRGFGIAPILGRLGIDNNFADLEWQIQPYAHGIKANNGNHETRITVHLIYGMAVPCSATRNCLFYLDDAGVDIVKDYIKQAAQRHWLVVLDDQLGLSDPATEVQHMIDKGYLQYDNVEVALDPEFRTAAGQDTPGIPIGSVTAQEVNKAADLLNAYSASHHLLHRKVLIVHQFRYYMITDRQLMRMNLPYVDPVVVADGFGTPGIKAHVYTDLFGAGTPPVTYYGIKLFLPNPYETTHHTDDPIMTWDQVFGHTAAVDPEDGKGYFVRPMPKVIVIA